MGSCYGGGQYPFFSLTYPVFSTTPEYEVDPLQPDSIYAGPSGTDDADMCKCNNVVYNLLSACTGCQEQTWIT